jgi:serine/threonine protein kinase
LCDAGNTYFLFNRLIHAVRHSYPTKLLANLLSGGARSAITRTMSTPPTEVPSCRKDERFKEIGAPCEWSELYRPGGYHPVHLGDAFSNGRYRVFRKLGDGSFATVWLAVDSMYAYFSTLNVCFIAEKIFAFLEKHNMLR